MNNINIDLDNIFAEDGLIAKLKEDYVPREAQIEASKTILNGIQNSITTFIEGETGMGKSFAYLFPSINALLEDRGEDGFPADSKLIIVTSGIALQEQLVKKDIPFVLKVLAQDYEYEAINMPYTLVKGKSNFICLDKAIAEGLTTGSVIDPRYKKLAEFVNTTSTGDLSELDFVPEKEVLESVTCSKNGECLGKKCPFYSDCFYYIHRQAVSNSRIIVTNYHYFYSNIKTGGAILPKANITVFDEAHEAATIYRDFNQIKVSPNSMMSFRNKITEVHNLTKAHINLLAIEPINELIRDFEIAFSKLGSLITNKFDEKPLIKNFDSIPVDILNLKKHLDDLFTRVCRAIEIQESLIEYNDDNNDSDSLEKALNALKTAFATLSEMIDFLIALKGNIEDPNIAVWTEEINGTFYLSSKPVNVSNSFKEQILSSETNTCIFTSATLSVAGSFDYVKSELGVDGKSLDYIGHSPFNLETQQLWYLPENAVEGNSPDFNKIYISQIEEIIKATNGGVLCLFTSVSAMKNAANTLRYRTNVNIMCQSEKPKTKLIEDFKADINSCLFATKSFFTGVDVKGKALRAVVIDKFPFPQPSDPIQKVLMDKPNAFYKYCIPEMVILFKQAVGRGVRGIDDKCVISILDNRLATARYKRKINSSFDYKKTATRDLEKVKQFIDEYIE